LTRPKGQSVNPKSPNDALESITAPASTPAIEPVRLIEDEATGDRFLLYTTDAGASVQLQYSGDSLWMTQAQIADLFGRDTSRISRHITNVLEEGELDETTSLRKAQTSHGRPATLYSLDMVISVGYRVSSRQGTVFRRWATDKLVQFATKGFVVDAERLKESEASDHFRELREIIRDIRASEANVYKEVRRICSLCSDYAAIPEQRRRAFFATVQNKLHYAVTQMTGAELRMQRADASMPNMGLASWPGRQITQRDTLTAKNYLGDAEVRDLNRFTGMLLDYFEQETDLMRLVTMLDAETKLDQFIRNNDRPLLQDKGGVSKADADVYVKSVYDTFASARRAAIQAASDDVD